MANIEAETMMKKTGGRRRIPIQKIQNKNSRNVAFSKRRAGLFSKASELSTLCGSEIAVLVFSESGKAFSFGHPCAESVIQRYVNGSNSSSSPPQTKISTRSGFSRDPLYAQSACDGSRKNYENADAFRWEKRIHMLGLNELRLYADYLQNLRDFVASKASSMASPPAYVADHGNQNTSSNDLLVHENCFDDVKWSDIESAMVNSPTNFVGESQLSDCFNWNEAESSKYMLLGEGTINGGYLQSDVLLSSSCADVDVQFDNSLSDIHWEDD